MAEDPCSFLSGVLPSTQASGCGLGFGRECVLFENVHDHWKDIPSQRKTEMSNRRRK